MMPRFLYMIRTKMDVDKPSLTVVPFQPKAAEKVLTAADVLENAKATEFSSVLVLGYDTEGAIVAYSTLDLKAPELLFLLERFKFKALNGDYKDES